MIRATNHSSYPRIGDQPLDQQIRSARRARARGRVGDDRVEEAEEEVITLVVADQARAFIDIVTDGQIRHEGPHSFLASRLEGLATAGYRRWLDTSFYDREVVVTGPIRRRGPFLVRDYEIAAGVALRAPVKTVLPGPATFSRLARDEHYDDRNELATDLADALAKEVEALVAAGARCFQVDEPLLCRHPEDVELVTECAKRIFAPAGKDDVTILSTYFGELGELSDKDLASLPGSHLGLDVCGRPQQLNLIGRLPEGKGVVLGAFDARKTRQEDAADVAQLLEPYRAELEGRDLIVGPNAGLELLPKDQAFDKLLHARYLVETLMKDWT